MAGPLLSRLKGLQFSARRRASIVAGILLAAGALASAGAPAGAEFLYRFAPGQSFEAEYRGEIDEFIVLRGRPAFVKTEVGYDFRFRVIARDSEGYLIEADMLRLRKSWTDPRFGNGATDYSSMFHRPVGLKLGFRGEVEFLDSGENRPVDAHEVMSAVAALFSRLPGTEEAEGNAWSYETLSRIPLPQSGIKTQKKSFRGRVGPHGEDGKPSRRLIAADYVQTEEGPGIQSRGSGRLEILFDVGAGRPVEIREWRGLRDDRGLPDHSLIENTWCERVTAAFRYF